MKFNQIKSLCDLFFFIVANESKELHKVRVDLSVSIFEQLTLPVRDGQSSGSEQKINVQQSDTDTIVNSTEASEIIVIYSSITCDY